MAGEPAGDSSQVSAEQQERLPWQHEDRVAAAGAKVWRWRSTLSPCRGPFTGKPWPLPSVPRAFIEGAGLWRLHREGLFVLSSHRRQTHVLGRAPAGARLADGLPHGDAPWLEASGDPGP